MNVGAYTRQSVHEGLFRQLTDLAPVVMRALCERVAGRRRRQPGVPPLSGVALPDAAPYAGILCMAVSMLSPLVAQMEALRVFFCMRIGEKSSTIFEAEFSLHFGFAPFYQRFATPCACFFDVCLCVSFFVCWRVLLGVYFWSQCNAFFVVFIADLCLFVYICGVGVSLCGFENFRKLSLYLIFDCNHFAFSDQLFVL